MCMNLHLDAIRFYSTFITWLGAAGLHLKINANSVSRHKAKSLCPRPNTDKILCSTTMGLSGNEDDDGRKMWPTCWLIQDVSLASSSSSTESCGNNFNFHHKVHR